MFSSGRTRFLAACRGAFNNILALALVLPAHAEKSVPPQLPPQPVPEKVQVERGGSVRIPLQTFGIPQDVEFRIHSKPQAGRLSGLRVLDKGLGVVTYTNFGEKGAGSDRFTYAAKSVLGVSAEVEVNIRVIEPPPRLEVPREMDFGKVLVGSLTTRKVVVENSGGGIAEGHVEAEPPWKVKGSAGYRIGAGESQAVVLALEPTNPGKMERDVVFTSDRTRTIAVRANVVSEIEAGPDPLLLKRSGTGSEREGMLDVVNNTPRSQTVGFEFGDGLRGEKELELAPLGSWKLKITAQIVSPNGYESSVTVKTEKENLHLRVVVPPLPGKIQLSPEALTLPSVSATQQFRTGLFTVENTGGQRVQVTLEAVPRIECEPKDSFDLEAGETRQIKVSVNGLATEAIEGVVTIISDGEPHRLPVFAPARTDTPASSSQPVSQPATSSGGLLQALTPLAGPAGTTANISPEMAAKALLSPGMVSVAAVTRSSATLSWAKPPKGAASYRLEQRELYFDDNKDLQQRWLPVENAAIVTTDKGASVKLTNLQPGTPCGFRVIAVSANGEESAPTTPAIFQTRPPLSFRPSLPQVLLAALALLVTAVIRQRRKRRD